ncbi:MAG: hypothetical protein KDA75_21325 [Planctomycetaceae bacterium]|nr:hypothetical protein [Planctomycetaceae bacterium]
MRTNWRAHVLFSLSSLLCVPNTGWSQPNRRPGQPTDGPSIVWVNEQPAKVDLPPGVTHRTFHSDAADQDVGYCLYLPPGYEHETERRYPVIYNLHGNGGNEFHSFEDVQVLHAGIIAGKWPPLIVVLPNGGKSTMYKDSYDHRFPIETMLIRELIPYIDANFRTIADREGRCIEGYSMGGRGSMRLAVKYPELFCSVFCQAGNVPRTSENYDPTTPDIFPNNYLGPDKSNYEANDAFVLAERNRGKIKNKLRIQILCGTKDGGHLPTIRDFHQHLVGLEIDHTYLELEGLGHNRKATLELLAPIWFDYHVESLRRSGAVPKQ